VVFARSRDGGSSWLPARSILDTGADRLTTGHQLVVLPGGSLLDVFTLIGLHTDPQQPELQVAMMRSDDRGDSWSRPTGIAELRSVGVVDPESGVPVASGTRLQPAVAVDAASGRAFVAWQDARFSRGQADAIALSWSRDGGRTWSRPVKANVTPIDIPVQTSRRSRRRWRYRPMARWASATLTSASTTRASPWRPIAGCCAAAPPHRRMRQAHRLTQAGPPGFFLGDYQGLNSAASDFLAVFAQPHQDDPASVFARRVTARTSHWVEDK
jgi:hypothetical protein